MGDLQYSQPEKRSVKVAYPIRCGSLSMGVINRRELEEGLQSNACDSGAYMAATAGWVVIAFLWHHLP